MPLLSRARSVYPHLHLVPCHPQLGIGVPAVTLLRFWTMAAHYHGQVWNAAEPARSLGISETTVRRYLDLLEGVFEGSAGFIVFSDVGGNSRVFFILII